jgi:hypothetical protein
MYVAKVEVAVGDSRMEIAGGLSVNYSGCKCRSHVYARGERETRLLAGISYVVTMQLTSTGLHPLSEYISGGGYSSVDRKTTM